MLKIPLHISPARFFLFRPTIKIKGNLLKKQGNELNDIEFYKHVQYCFCCYAIKSAGVAANKVLLSVVWNPLLIGIHLSQIRTLDIKREKVCAVCPYLLFKTTIMLLLFASIDALKNMERSSFRTGVEELDSEFRINRRFGNCSWETPTANLQTVKIAHCIQHSQPWQQ